MHHRGSEKLAFLPQQEASQAVPSTAFLPDTGLSLLYVGVVMATMQLSRNSLDSPKDDHVNREQKVKKLQIAIGPISGNDLQYCTDACLRRYLEARNWNIDKSKKMLEESLKWRYTFRPEGIRWLEVAHEGESGKAYRATFRDHQGRVVLVLRPGKQNTSSHDNQLRHLVYLMENAILNAPEGQEQMVWLIDFTGWSLNKAVPIKTARETINILQSHYRERLYAAFLYNPPRVFEAFWKVVKYFLDAKTFQKVKFVYPKNGESMELMQRNFDMKILPVEFGGKNKVEYNHEEYSRLMVRDEARVARIR